MVEKLDVLNKDKFSEWRTWWFQQFWASRKGWETKTFQF